MGVAGEVRDVALSERHIHTNCLTCLPPAFPRILPAVDPAELNAFLSIETFSDELKQLGWQEAARRAKHALDRVLAQV